MITSSYYLSPMFRLFLLFSDTKFNRAEMITPGIFGTLHGSFIGLASRDQVQGAGEGPRRRAGTGC